MILTQNWQDIQMPIFYHLRGHATGEFQYQFAGFSGAHGPTCTGKPGLFELPWGTDGGIPAHEGVILQVRTWSKEQVELEYKSRIEGEIT